MLQGSMVVIVAGERHRLGPGDGIWFLSSQPHTFELAGEEECVSVWADTVVDPGVIRGGGSIFEAGEGCGPSSPRPRPPAPARRAIGRWRSRASCRSTPRTCARSSSGSPAPARARSASAPPGRPRTARWRPTRRPSSRPWGSAASRSRTSRSTRGASAAPRSRRAASATTPPRWAACRRPRRRRGRTAGRRRVRRAAAPRRPRPRGRRRAGGLAQAARPRSATSGSSSGCAARSAWSPTARRAASSTNPRARWARSTATGTPARRRWCWWPRRTPSRCATRSAAAPPARASTLDAEITPGAPGANVVGYLAGERDGPPIVVGAHHDGWFSAAFDNATGVAAMLAIARGLAATGHRPRHTLCFTSRTAEEYGLLDNAFDWCIGAWRQVTDTHPEWGAGVPFHLCVEASGHPDLRLLLETPVELAGWARRAARVGRKEGWLTSRLADRAAGDRHRAVAADGLRGPRRHRLHVGEGVHAHRLPHAARRSGDRGLRPPGPPHALLRLPAAAGRRRSGRRSSTTAPAPRT